MSVCLSDLLCCRPVFVFLFVFFAVFYFSLFWNPIRFVYIKFWTKLETDSRNKGLRKSTNSLFERGFVFCSMFYIFINLRALRFAYGRHAPAWLQRRGGRSDAHPVQGPERVLGVHRDLPVFRRLRVQGPEGHTVGKKVLHVSWISINKVHYSTVKCHPFFGAVVSGFV